MKAASIGDHKRICGNAEAARLWKAEFLKFAPRNSQRAALRQAVALAQYRQALLHLPLEASPREPMRTGDVGQRAFVLLDVRQKIPGFQRRLERIRVQLDLRIGRSLGDSAKDRLDVIERLATGARHIAHQTLPPGILEQRIELGQAAAERPPDCNPASDRIALLLFATFQPGGEDRRSELGKILISKQVANDNESVSVELFPLLCG
jgi:hypothetical protein